VTYSRQLCDSYWKYFRKRRRRRRRKPQMFLKLCCCLGGQGDDNNNNNNKRQPATSETGCLMCCCCPCLFRCRHKTSAHPQVSKDEEGTPEDGMGTGASTPVISLTPPLNKYSRMPIIRIAN
jgi:hypothetical protein